MEINENREKERERPAIMVMETMMMMMDNVGNEDKKDVLFIDLGVRRWFSLFICLEYTGGLFCFGMIADLRVSVFL